MSGIHWYYLLFRVLLMAVNNSKRRCAFVASIDLVILGMVLEHPRSAYDLQKDVEYHRFSRWTRISVPSVYRKVLELKARGYL